MSRTKGAFLAILLMLIPPSVIKGGRALRASADSVFLEHIPRIWKLLPKMTLQQGADLWAGINAILLSVLAKDVLVMILDRVFIGMLDMNPEDAAVAKRRVLKLALYTPTIGSLVAEMEVLDDPLETRQGSLNTINAFKLDSSSLTGAFLALVELGVVVREHYLTRRAAKTFADGVTKGDPSNPFDMITSESGDPISVSHPFGTRSLYTHSDYLAHKFANALITPEFTGDIDPLEDLMMTRVPGFHISENGEVEVGHPLAWLVGPAVKYLGKTTAGKAVVAAAKTVGKKALAAGQKLMTGAKAAAPMVGRTARDVTAFTAMDMALGAALPGGPPLEPSPEGSLDPALVSHHQAGDDKPGIEGLLGHVMTSPHHSNLPTLGARGTPYTTPSIPIPTELVTALGLTSGDVGTREYLSGLMSGDIDNDPIVLFSDDFMVNDPATLEIGGLFSGFKKGFKKLKKKISMKNIGKGIKKALDNPLVNTALNVAGAFVPGVSAITGLLGSVAGGSPMESLAAESLQNMGSYGASPTNQNNALAGIRQSLGGSLGAGLQRFLSPGGDKSNDLMAIMRFVNSPEFAALVDARSGGLRGQPIKTMRMNMPLNFRISAEMPGVEPPPEGSRVTTGSVTGESKPRRSRRPAPPPPSPKKRKKARLGIKTDLPDHEGSRRSPFGGPRISDSFSKGIVAGARNRRKVDDAFKELDAETAKLSGDPATPMTSIPSHLLAGLLASAYGDVESVAKSSKRAIRSRITNAVKGHNKAVSPPSNDEILAALETTKNWYANKHSLSGNNFVKFTVISKMLEQLGL